MKQNKKHTLFALFAALCLCFTSIGISVSPQAAAAQTAETAGYTAFGDSIAAGYGLDGYSHDQQAAPSESYQALTAGFLHTQPHNYAVSGSDSSDCIELLRSGTADDDLAAADIITLSIGSNDLLLPFIQIVLDHFQIDQTQLDPSAIEKQLQDGFSMPQLDPSKMAEYYKQAQQLLNDLSDHAELHAQAAAFPQQLQTILSILHEKAPDAEVYVTNVYNPFASLPKIGELADIYIQEINQAFSTDAPDYTLIDLYTPFQAKGLTNVHIDLTQPSGMSLDPHPSVQGHTVIAQLITKALSDAHAPKAASLRSLSASSKKKLTVKLKLPSDADSCQILYATAKNGSYKVLGTTEKQTFQTSSKKLKTGKTYYIKLRSCRTYKGVVYYGKDSSTKKITMK
ncbi:MAG: SGNH/GDSL hydrolase family protein [Eubacterium sp.]|nr:SGNH/GDSL hydrolase family protein [Eubacterium sp.]